MFKWTFNSSWCVNVQRLDPRKDTIDIYRLTKTSNVREMSQASKHEQLSFTEVVVSREHGLIQMSQESQRLSSASFNRLAFGPLTAATSFTASNGNSMATVSHRELRNSQNTWKLFLLRLRILEAPTFASSEISQQPPRGTDLLLRLQLRSPRWCSTCEIRVWCITRQFNVTM